MNAVFSLREVTLGYDDGHPAVHRLTGSISPGSLTAVIGPNGSGKSTLLKALIGFLKPLRGSLERGGLEPTDIAYLPQQVEIDRSFPVSVIETVLLGHWRRIGLFHPVTRTLRSEAEAALNTVGLGGFDDRPIESLSAGQLQRVLFARMVVQDRAVILLDEPFAAIDSRTSADLLRLVARWHGEGRTVIAVLHDLEQVRDHFPETLLIAREAIAWGATAEVLQGEHLEQARQAADRWDERADARRWEAPWHSMPR